MTEALRTLVYVVAGHVLGSRLVGIQRDASIPGRRILGAFTTFSSFSLDFAVLYERGQLLLCTVYVGVSVVCSIGALFAGMLLFRRLLSATS